MIRLTIDEVARRIGENVAVVEKCESLLHKLCVGQEFSIEGIDFIVLDKKYDEQGHVLAITKNIYQFASFNDTSNNLAQLPIGKCETAYEVLRRFAIKIQNGDKNRIASKITSLISDNGLSDYGEMVQAASILTLDEFKKYRPAIPKIIDNWWLATPHGTGSSDSTESVCYINAHSNVESARYDEELGIRPVVLLKDTLNVMTYEIMTMSNVPHLK